MATPSLTTQAQPRPSQPIIWQQTNWLVGGVLLGLSVSLLAATEAGAASISFTKIADTSTPIPGGTGNFFELDYPALDGNDVVFVGRGSDGYGVYTGINSSLQVVANTSTLIPGGTGTFEQFGFLTTINQGNVAFDGYRFNEPQQRGIYTNSGGLLQVVANLNTPVPGGAGNFTDLFAPVLSDGELAFFGRDAKSKEGIYTAIDGLLKVVANTNTPVPSGTGNFTYFNTPALSNGDIVFRGFGNGLQNGIYTNIGDTLRLVADTSTPIPGGTGNFTNLADPDISDGNVVFLAFDSGQLPGIGIYSDVGGSLQVVADTNTLVPNGIGNFSRLFNPGISGDTVVFEGLDSSEQAGIYSNIGGSLGKVIAQGDSLDGKTVSRLLFTRDGLSGNSLAFWAEFTDNSAGVFRADLAFNPPERVPEPSSVLGLLAFGTVAGSSLVKRKLKSASRN